MEGEEDEGDDDDDEEEEDWEEENLEDEKEAKENDKEDGENEEDATQEDEAIELENEYEEVEEREKESEDNHVEDEDEAPQKGHGVRQKQPPRNISKNVKGQLRQYHFLKTVKSMEDLDKLRFMNFCQFGVTSGQRKVFKSFAMPCSTNFSGKGAHCNFELRAVRPDFGYGNIHVYAHSAHNHPFQSEEKRAGIIRRGEKVSHANPPPILHTSDNTEWKFLQTFSDYEKLQEFRHKNKCKLSTSIAKDERTLRLHYYCNHRSTRDCKFRLLAIKTITDGYHVYNQGEHNHSALDLHSRVMIPPMADDNPPAITRKPDNFEWTFLGTFSDLGRVDKFRRVNECRSRHPNTKGVQIRYYCHLPLQIFASMQIHVGSNEDDQTTLPCLQTWRTHPPSCHEANE